MLPGYESVLLLVMLDWGAAIAYIWFGLARLLGCGAICALPISEGIAGYELVSASRIRGADMEDMVKLVLKPMEAAEAGGWSRGGLGG